jgi:hypothetical protein
MAAAICSDNNTRTPPAICGARPGRRRFFSLRGVPAGANLLTFSNHP